MASGRDSREKKTADMAYTTENNPFSVISYRCSILCAKVQKIRRNNADFFENRHFFDL